MFARKSFVEVRFFVSALLFAFCFALLIACSDDSESCPECNDDCNDACDEDCIEDGDDTPTPQPDGDETEGNEQAESNPFGDCESGPCLGAPDAVDFGAVNFGMSNEQTISVTNLGEGKLYLRDIFLTDKTSADFEILEPMLPLAAPQLIESPFPITIRYTRNGIEGDQGTLVLTSNDVLQANKRIELINDYKGQADLSVDPAEIDFGTIAQGDESEPVSFTLTCTGDTDGNRILMVDSIQMAMGAMSSFVLRPDPVNDDASTDCRTPFLMPIGSMKTCRVVFRPASVGGVGEEESLPFEDTMIISIEDRGEDAGELSVTLSGIGESRQCTTDEECDDGLFCTSDDRCSEEGYCVATANSRDCSTAVIEPSCQVGVCNEVEDRCEAENLEDGLTVCNDDPTNYQVCHAGACIEADLQLSEVLYNVSGDDNEYEWVEIYNASPVALNLSHYKIAGGADAGTGGYLFTYNGFLSGTIPAGGCYVVGGPLRSEDNANPVFDLEINFEDDLQNGGSNAGNGVGLFNIMRDGNISGTSIPVDTVIYGLNNDDELLCPDGDPCEGADVQDCGSNNTVEKTSEGAWRINEQPSPGTCLMAR